MLMTYDKASIHAHRPRPDTTSRTPHRRRRPQNPAPYPPVEARHAPISDPVSIAEEAAILIGPAPAPADSGEPRGQRFQDLAIHPDIRGVLDRQGFVTPTPIQQAAIPLGLEGKDLIGIAQTGTGKTLAFGIPMVQLLHGKRGSAARGLVVVPTRELALQVAETLQKIGRPLRMSVAVLIGGAPIGPQKAALRGEPHMVVATPGRLIDHVEQGNTVLQSVRILVLDEADRMLDMGFAPQINRILRATPTDRQTMLFSATMPADIVEIAAGHMRLPVNVEISPPGSTVAELSQELVVVKKEDKTSLLLRLLDSYSGSVLVFSRTKHGAKKIVRDVVAAGHRGAEIHSNRTLAQRREALDGFRAGRYRVLVATDIAARGIDVTNIQLVVNYDIPEQPDDYVHRVGRTGRAGRTGHAITFAMPDQGPEVRSIERLIRSVIEVSADSEHELEAPVSAQRRKPGRGAPHRSVGSGGDPRPGRPPHRPRPARTEAAARTGPETGAPQSAPPPPADTVRRTESDRARPHAPAHRASPAAPGRPHREPPRGRRPQKDSG